MRVFALLPCVIALAACGDRRSFDQRYNDAGAELEQRAEAIDQNLANAIPATGENHKASPAGH